MCIKIKSTYNNKLSLGPLTKLTFGPTVFVEYIDLYSKLLISIGILSVLKCKRHTNIY